MTKVETIRNWIACPQFGDDHYGELGALPYHKRKILKDLCDYVEPLEQHDLEISKSYIELQQRLDKAIELNKQIKSFVYNEMVDNYVPGSTELYELVNEELKVLGGKNE